MNKRKVNRAAWDIAMSRCSGSRKQKRLLSRLHSWMSPQEINAAVSVANNMRQVSAFRQELARLSAQRIDPLALYGDSRGRLAVLRELALKRFASGLGASLNSSEL